MTAPDTGTLLERLRAHATLAGVPGHELEWLIAHGELKAYAVGETVSSRNEIVQALYIVLSGRIAIHVEKGGIRHRLMEWRAGEVTGLLPYSRMTKPPGDTVVEEPLEVLSVAREALAELARECPGVTATLVHVMTDRARRFNAADLHDEKMVSLGRLAAGLAHELNNPASAVARSAKLLAGELAEAEAASRALGAAQLTPGQLDALDDMRNMCLATPTMTLLSPIQFADHEEAIADWLQAHGANVGAAPALADTVVTFDALDQLASVISGPALDAALRWIAAGCSVRTLATEIEQAATRIYDLVDAVKGFTYMDRATVPEPVNVGKGLSNTLAVLASKARSKSVAVALQIAPDLPRVRGFGGELNQVWSNLVDNALDAVAPMGSITITAEVEVGWVVVRVVDDGPGIPPEVVGRIFDPFFTTKPVGQGTGLGLDIVQRIVRRNQGEIDVESRPGRTAFRVALPIA